ncbi:MAG: hypothetical protein HZA48_07150 [Planctomycetes bacterium]|nr:hypothetical protein [Planctomycetota bacterium]
MEWTFQKIGKLCAKCAQGFKDEQAFISALFLSKDTVLRKDYCEPCWIPADEPEHFSFWKSVIPKKNAPKPDNRHNVMQVLEKLIGQAAEPVAEAAAENTAEGAAQPLSEEGRKKLIFLLALTLMRKKALKLKETCTENNEEVMVMEKVADGTILRIPVFNLPENDVNTLKDDLAKILDM